MLSPLLVAGAASGEFLTPIKSHHHQESLNLKESAGKKPHADGGLPILPNCLFGVITQERCICENSDMLTPQAITCEPGQKCQVLSDSVQCSTASSIETSQTRSSSMGAGSSHTGSGDCKEQDCIMESLAARHKVVRDQLLEALTKHKGNKAGMARLLSQQAAGNKAHDRRSGMAVDRWKGVKARQQDQSDFSSGASRNGNRTLGESDEPMDLSLSSSAGGASRFGLGGYNSGSAVGFGGSSSSTQGSSGSGLKDCPAFGSAYERCWCQSAYGKEVCEVNQTCNRSSVGFGCH